LEKKGQSSDTLYQNLIKLFQQYVRTKHFCKNIPSKECSRCTKKDIYNKLDNTGKIYKAKQIYGADILIKTNLQPYILEMNVNPALALSNDSQLDWKNDMRITLLHHVKNNHYDPKLFSHL
jgi:hypothetical protein